MRPKSYFPLFTTNQPNTERAFGRIPAYCKYELFMERYRSAAEIIRQHISLDEHSRLLDVGCGNGYMKYFFDQHEGQWFGIERWKERAQECRDMGYTVIEIDLDENNLPYDDEYFDVVFASHVIEHLRRIAHVIQEMGRVLRKGGILLVATPTKPPMIAGLINLYHKLRGRRVGETQNAFSILSLKRLMRTSLVRGEWQLLDARGFRILSSRRRLRLENYFWFYRINTIAGKYLTSVTPEVNLIYKKTA